MTSLALLEPEIPYPLDVTGKNNVYVLLALMVAVVAFPLCMDVVEVMVVRMVPFLKQEVGIGLLPKMVLRHFGTGHFDL